jgi:hypothetical protein
MSALSWGGRIENLSPINDADRIVRADVDCGPGGRWSGVVRKDDFKVNDSCLVILADAIVPDEPMFAFLKDKRIKMMRLRGCPSEVLIIKEPSIFGESYDQALKVTKYEKPLPAGGNQVGSFPSNIPKTDEPNFQIVPQMVEALEGMEYYATVKYDGSSHTVFYTDGKPRICSRNWEVERNEIIEKYKFRNLDIGRPLAIQFELIGPGVQGNPLGLEDKEIRVFSIYDIENHTYLGFNALVTYCDLWGLPMVEVVKRGYWNRKSDDEIRDMAKGTYPNGKPREGIVIRPTAVTRVGQRFLSFKIINLDYES